MAFEVTIAYFESMASREGNGMETESFDARAGGATSVLVIDPERELADLESALLSNARDWEVIGPARDPEGAFRLALGTCPQIIVAAWNYGVARMMDALRLLQTENFHPYTIVVVKSGEGDGSLIGNGAGIYSVVEDTGLTSSRLAEMWQQARGTAGPTDASVEACAVY